MHRTSERVELVLHHDLLCGWCYLADRRLAVLLEELGGAVTLEHRAFPTWIEERMPVTAELQGLARTLRRVAREPDGKGVGPELWVGGDPPRSSMPPLLAAEAARIVGGLAARDRLVAAIREAAFSAGLNVAREDVLLELAERAGLDLSRFSTALHNQGTRKLVTDQHEDAYRHGIRAVPSLVIGGEWLLTGARSLDEYRITIRRYLDKGGLHVPERTLH